MALFLILLGTDHKFEYVNIYFILSFCLNPKLGCNKRQILITAVTCAHLAPYFSPISTVPQGLRVFENVCMYVETFMYGL